MRPIYSLFALVTGVGVVAATAPAARGDGDPHITYEKYKLGNGLEIILAPDPSVPLVAVDVWYHVGTGDEVVGRSGFAHLFEHMMFQGSKNVGADRHFDILKKLGAEDVNGTTNNDRTNYYEVVPSNQLETALWLESDRMSHLLELLDKDQLANQISVVRNERRQSYDNRPYTKARFARYALLYPEGHPYRFMTIGRHEDLEAASVDDVKAFYKTWYVPANATVAISGDFAIADAKALVDKWFGSLPPSAKPAVVTIPAPTVKAQEVSVEDPLAKLPELVFAWHSPAQFGDGDAELDIAADVLAREGPGRLYKRLVYDNPLAQQVFVRQGGSQFSGTFEITVTVRSTAADKLDQIKQIVADEVTRLGRDNVSDREIARVVSVVEARSIRGLETAFGRAQQLQEYNHYLGDPDRLSWDLDRFRKTTPDKVRAVVAQYLGMDHAITSITLPGGAK
jgi:predicted Zn-dependent peptidase